MSDYVRRSPQRQPRRSNGTGRRVLVRALVEPDLAERLQTLARAKDVSQATILRDAIALMFASWH
jgi:hypothetical protein